MARAAASTMRSCVASLDLPAARFILRASYCIPTLSASGISAIRLLSPDLQTVLITGTRMSALAVRSAVVPALDVNPRPTALPRAQSTCEDRQRRSKRTGGEMRAVLAALAVAAIAVSPD